LARSATFHVALVPQRCLGATAHLDARRPTPSSSRCFITLTSADPFIILTSVDPDGSAAGDPH
jgi:hypothetical protein